MIVEQMPILWVGNRGEPADRAAVAATRLLQASGEIVVALESLAAAVGTGPSGVLEPIGAGP